jgi:putative transposase
MKKEYRIISKKDSRQMAEFLARNGQTILPMLDLLQSSQIAVDELIEQLGRATLEAVLLISADEIAGKSHQGKKGGQIIRHGKQQGVVSVSNRKLRVEKPRLRQKDGAEVEVPAYRVMQNDEKLTQKSLEAMMCGVSTRNYKALLTHACEAVGVSKSSVSRKFVLASQAKCQQLLERRLDDRRYLILYIDGVRFAEHHVIAAVGVDDEGEKRVLGLIDGSTENTVVVKDLLLDLVERGLCTQRQYLFVIDGSKALSKAIEEVFGSQPVQRCRLHKLRNVASYLPDFLREQTLTLMRAAFKLDAKEGMKRLEKLASWLENEYPSAVSSLREGLKEMFTVNRLGLPPSLRRVLSSTNLIESPNSGVRLRTRRVGQWKDGKMVLRWACSAFLAVEENYRKLSGYKDLWMLQATLNTLCEEKVDTYAQAV